MARGWGYGNYYGFRPYVSVAQRRAKAKRHAASLAKKGHTVQPIEINGRTIAKTFWGKAWCDNLESYSDYENRLPRGRTYVRNGSVVDLQITGGNVTATVSGSDIYSVKIEITPLDQQRWKKIQRDCAQSIDSLIDLLQGRFSKGVMERLTRQKEGLFPDPREIKIRCSCPDWATLCKHAAAVLYGVGARLDTEPEMLFQLREVDHLSLISQAVSAENLDAAFSSDASDSLEGQDLSDLFGIELEAESGSAAATATLPVAAKSTGRRKTTTRSTVKNRTSTAKPKRTNKRATGRGSTVQPSATAKSVTKKNTNKKVAAKKKVTASSRATTATAVKRKYKKKTAARKQPAATGPAKKKAPRKKK